MPTKKQIEACQTPAGGYDKKTLSRWGVPWPPPKGWKKKLISETQKKAKAARLAQKQEPDQ
jgi:hypothetical protein